ncbi:MAG: helix-turn-helix transcriptional regulator [Pseudomonadota bacterium]
MSIEVHLDALMRRKSMTGKELATKIDLTEANVSLLRSGKVKGIRFSTLEKICEALNCAPGDVLKLQK